MAGITAFQIISTVIGVASAASSFIQGKKAQKATRAAAEERREAGRISEASQQNIDRIQRRKAIRDERVRRAKIIQRAQGVGAAGSSAALAGPGIIGTNIAAAISAQASGARAAQGISSRLQSAADLQGQAAAATATGALFSAIGTSIVGVVEEFDIFQQPVFPSTKKKTS